MTVKWAEEQARETHRPMPLCTMVHHEGACSGCATLAAALEKAETRGREELEEKIRKSLEFVDEDGSEGSMLIALEGLRRALKPGAAKEGK